MNRQYLGLLLLPFIGLLWCRSTISTTRSITGIVRRFSSPIGVDKHGVFLELARHAPRANDSFLQAPAAAPPTRDTLASSRSFASQDESSRRWTRRLRVCRPWPRCEYSADERDEFSSPHVSPHL